MTHAFFKALALPRQRVGHPPMAGEQDIGAWAR